MLRLRFVYGPALASVAADRNLDRIYASAA